MTCFYPIPAYRASEINPETGKRGLVFNGNNPARLREGLSMTVPCQKCVGCRIDRSRDWAVRCMHEAQVYPGNNCFLTLTYEDKYLPDDYSVSVETHQIFIRALRDSLPHKIRFFACGEYGSDHDENPLSTSPLRPHYHYLIFNYRPNDLKLHSKKNSIPLYTSEKISKIWTNGFSTVGELTYQTAAYCARYVIKKIGGDLAAEHYTRIHPLTGKQVQVHPEFAKQSLKPGIGEAWYNTFKSDIYPSDFCVVEGKKHPVPKYYFKKLAEEERNKLKIRRSAASLKSRADKTSARLRTRELVKLAQVKQLKRDL